MRRSVPSALALVLAVLSRASAAGAAPPPDVMLGPTPAGVHALTVRVDPEGTVMYRTCPTVPCTLEPFASTTLASKLGAQGTATVLAFGDKHVVHVKVPVAGGAWEAVLSGKPDAPVIFSGRTGLVRGQEGERSGEIVQLVEDDGGKHLMIAEVREDLRICGQAMTPLSPRVLDPKSFELRGATVPRLPADQRANAAPVIATEHAGALEPPLARLFAAVGASSAIGAPQALVDGDPQTAWAESRLGDGHGEFVLLRGPAEVPVARLAIVPIPAPKEKAPDPKNVDPKNADPKKDAKPEPKDAKPEPKDAKAAAKLAAPRKVFLVTDERTIAITLPEDAAQHPGRAYDVALPQPIKSSCAALVLEDAYATSAAKPEVTIAELYAYSEVEQGATVEAVAKALSGGGPRADAAAGVLKRAGEPGTKAIAGAFPQLDPAGRALAVEVAVTAPCDASAPLLVGALGDADREVARKARGKLERCGKAAAPALSAAVAGSDPKARALAAPILGTIAPSAALDPLARAMGDGPADVRSEVRGAFARAARSASAPDLQRLIAGVKERPELARLDLLRAMNDRLPDVAPDAKAALEPMLAPGASLSSRYLALGPLARLAATDAALAARLSAAIASDESWPVRARAAEVAPAVPGARAALARAVDDPEPRVREAALRAASEAKLGEIAAPAVKRLAGDPWTFVRLAAASALGALPAAAEADAALATSAKQDASPRVKAGALGALGAHGARAHKDVAIERLEDRDEDGEVRVAAAKALGAMCEAGGLDALTRAARASTSPLATGEDLAVGAAALRALAAIHPADLKARLEPLLGEGARAETKRAAEAALAERGACR